LRDESRDTTVPESSIIIEYLDLHYPGPTRFIPSSHDRALQTRLRERFFDLYVHLPMQKIMGDRLCPEGSKDPHGVEVAGGQLSSVFGTSGGRRPAGRGAVGGQFTMADCGALPALFYGNMVEPFPANQGRLAAYFERLKARPSVARVIREAEPFFAM